MVTVTIPKPTTPISNANRLKSTFAKVKKLNQRPVVPVVDVKLEVDARNSVS